MNTLRERYSSDWPRTVSIPVTQIEGGRVWMLIKCSFRERAYNWKDGERCYGWRCHRTGSRKGMWMWKSFLWPLDKLTKQTTISSIAQMACSSLSNINSANYRNNGTLFGLLGSKSAKRAVFHSSQIQFCLNLFYFASKKTVAFAPWSIVYRCPAPPLFSAWVSW